MQERWERQRKLIPAALIAGTLAAVLAGCGSTTTKTIVEVRTDTVTATPSAASTTPTTTTDTGTDTTAAGGTDTSTSTTTSNAIPAVSAGAIPALNGTYSLDQTSHSDDYELAVISSPHDGIYNADQQWSILGGSCSGGGKCTLSLRRVMSDSTIEGVKLTAPSPTGVYTGAIPGGDGKAGCGSNLGIPIRLSMIIRVGGLQKINGQQVASRLAGHIFADYHCPGSTPAHVVATYVGQRQ